MELSFSTISWVAGHNCHSANVCSENRAALSILDQSSLPNEVRYEIITTPEDMAYAIKTLKVRGAPLIGICAAYGVALASYCSDNIEEIKQSIVMLENTRPTAYNLFSALNRIKSVLSQYKRDYDLFRSDIRDPILETAHIINEEEREICNKIGKYGVELIPQNAKCITHCNAGALATSGIGTALAPIYIAKEQDKFPMVFARETRPVLQGARLTAWELKQANIPVTLLPDSASGYLMTQEKIDLCIVGADRIARNGDTANKIGTYTLAVLAKKHNIPFYVAAPLSSFDPSAYSGDDIRIEFRSEDEVRKIGNAFIAPKDVHVFNPAFDITPAKYITAFITEKGICKPPF